jgi:hypothetical protein
LLLETDPFAPGDCLTAFLYSRFSPPRCLA